MENKTKYDKSFAHIQARNIRYLFVVDNAIKIEDLIFLFESNMRFWGGRFNPIIPSNNGVISDDYISLALHFDPDYVVYSDPKCLQTLQQNFHPVQFLHIPHLSHYNLEGLDESLLLNLSYGYDTVLTENYLYKSLPDLYDFYKLNFGFLNGDDNDSVRKFKQVEINSDNQGQLDDILACHNVFLVSKLSVINTLRPYLKSSGYNAKGIELIVADESNPFNDLIYFWNRQLYAQRDYYSLNQIYVTKKQLELFISTSKIDFFFNSFCGNEGMTISSISLDEKTLKEITERFNKWQKRCQPARQIPKPKFPFKIDGLWPNNDYDEPEIKQSLNGKHDLVQLPELSFVNSSRTHGKWAVDVMLERYENIKQNKVFLPQKEHLSHLFTDITGRINRQYTLSFIVDRENKFFDFRIPTDTEILRLLTLNPYRSGARDIDSIKTSDDGLRLTSLVELFKSNYEVLAYYFQNEFWLQVFRGKSIKLGDDRMKNSKGVVSYLDLQAEYKSMIEKEGFIFDAIVYEGDNNELLDGTNELIENGALFIGNRIKCANCGSAHWYSLDNLSISMSCKGCLQPIKLEAEQLPYYKINDVIRNNLISNSGSKNNLHGNLTVLYTLLHFRNDSWHSFMAMPQQNYYKPGATLPSSDIDILCVSDGKLIIGEAKNSVDEFKNKEIDNLIFLGNSIDPNKIVLAFNEGDEKKLNEAVQKIKDGLKNKGIFVEPYKIISPWFNSRNTRILKEQQAK